MVGVLIINSFVRDVFLILISEIAVLEVII